MERESDNLFPQALSYMAISDSRSQIIATIEQLYPRTDDLSMQLHGAVRMHEEEA